ncbi:hypothetical protein PHJA_001675900 [Phtheirospermum japonicum]|uniref:Uncharacterized protein n=1 Tax=Phtheirospermum japonicum TaxID=374723 RepID=A0A830C848_9LAMI|nr:hypothetical protein PHJA_001675900 [Phtheirospermum japonicum]
MGVDEVLKLVVEKLKEFLLALENLGGEALAWFDNIFPPETRASKISHWIHVALPYLITAVVLTALVCCCRCCCGGGRVRTMKAPGGGGKGKMMKAPGRDYKMPRRDFESNPKGYFSDLRGCQ